jgi:hypothetical protein
MGVGSKLMTYFEPLCDLLLLVVSTLRSFGDTMKLVNLDFYACIEKWAAAGGSDNLRRCLSGEKEFSSSSYDGILRHS